MPKYFVPQDVINDDVVTVRDDNARHLIKVLRAKTGDEIIICDGNRNDYFCEIEKIERDENIISMRVVERRACISEPPAKITLYQSAVRADKMEFIIQKCVELGVGEIAPVKTERSGPSDSGKKTARFRKIAESAAGQSMRGIVPLVREPVSFEEALTDSTNDEKLSLVAYENERVNNISGVLKDIRPRSLSIWVGPEGGFAEREIECLLRRGARCVTLGSRVLRTETAGLTALIKVLTIWEELMWQTAR